MKFLDNRWYLVIFLLLCFLAMGVGSLLSRTKKLLSYVRINNIRNSFRRSDSTTNRKFD